MNILITGGAGYIGSAVARRLLDEGHKVAIIDNLSTGDVKYIDDRSVFFRGNILDVDFLKKVLESNKFDAVMHFAALKDIGESMCRPDLYTSCNITGTINILEAARSTGIGKIIFASSAAVYGAIPEGTAIESSPCNPTNYYGKTKHIGETIVEHYSKAYNIDSICFRYFNVAGDSGLRFIDTKAKNIFNIVAEVAAGKQKILRIFGDDYDTKDGSGVRDYVHIDDLVDAHILALDLRGNHVFNLGTENGYSVLEIIDAFRKKTGHSIPTEITARREGDIAKLTASCQKARETLKWNPVRTLDDMVESAWNSYIKQ